MTVWRSADGRFHTVAVPDPSSVLGMGVVAHVEGLVTRHGLERVESALERAQRRVVAEAAEEWDQAEEDWYEDRAAQWSGDVQPLDDLEAFITALVEAAGPRWALDVLLAAEDAADQASASGT